MTQSKTIYPELPNLVVSDAIPESNKVNSPSVGFNVNKFFVLYLLLATAVKYGMFDIALILTR